MPSNINSKKNTLLWKFINPDNNNLVYLYGTIHLRDKRVYFRLEELKSIIRTCDYFIGEYDLDSTDDTALMKEIQLPIGKNLSDYYYKHTYQNIKYRIKKAFKIDLDRFKFLRPIAIENFITESVFNQDYFELLDVELWKFASSCGIKTLGAESNKSQLHIIRNMNLQLQLKSLRKIAGNTSKHRKQLLQLVEYYQNQMIVKLYQKSIKNLGSLKRTLVYDRNYRMVDKIIKTSPSGHIFVSVGAGHLCGKYGLIKLLKDNGYKIQNI